MNRISCKSAFSYSNVLGLKKILMSSELILNLKFHINGKKLSNFTMLSLALLVTIFFHLINRN